GALGYIMLVAGTMLVLDQLEVPFGMLYGGVLTAVSGITTLAFLFFVDRDRVISGAHRKRNLARGRVRTAPKPGGPAATS
ncbi:MAG: hypothetical protein OXL34_06210, partial [Gemmatimonadota bacterium]|nr:hypothetical protein [Gemmatimonadota bacterium]